MIDPRIEVAPNKISYTLLEACAATGIGRTRMYQLVAAGLITPKKCGRNNLFSHDDLVRLIQNLPESGISKRRRSEEGEAA
jgi:hypothetical protein